MQDVVHLKNGKVIKGIITEQIPNKSLKIKLEDGTLFLYDMDEISQITKEVVDPVTSIKSKKVSPNNANMLSIGWHGDAGLGFGWCLGDYKDMKHYDVTLQYGYQFKENLYAGLGINLDLYSAKGQNGTKGAVPIYAEGRYYYPIKSELLPFISLCAGMAVGEINGFYFFPTIGVRFPLGPKNYMRIAFGYQSQQVETMKDINIDYATGTMTYTKSKEGCGSIVFRILYDF